MSLSFQQLLSTSPSQSPVSQNALPDRPEEKEGHSPQGTPVASRRPSFEGVITYTDTGQPVLQLLAREDANSLGLSSIRLSVNGKEEPHRGARLLRGDQFLPPPSRDPSPPPPHIRFKEVVIQPAYEKQIWALRVQDLLAYPREQEAQQLLQWHGGAFDRFNREFNRLYVQLHFLTSDQKKIEEVFLTYLQRHSDILAGRLFVRLLTRRESGKQQLPFYFPSQVKAFLKELKFVRSFEKLSWYQATSSYLEKEKSPGVETLSETLKKCAELFQEHLDMFSLWILETDDALNRGYAPKNPGEIAPRPLTPRSGCNLLKRLIQEFDRAYSRDLNLPVEIRRLRLQLSFLYVSRLVAEQTTPETRKSYEQLLENPLLRRQILVAKILFERHTNVFPNDFLAWKYYLSFEVDCLKDYESFSSTRKDLNFPPLRWLDELAKRAK